MKTGTYYPGLKQNNTKKNLQKTNKKKNHTHKKPNQNKPNNTPHHAVAYLRVSQGKNQIQ